MPIGCGLWPKKVIPSTAISHIFLSVLRGGTVSSTALLGSFTSCSRVKPRGVPVALMKRSRMFCPV